MKSPDFRRFIALFFITICLAAIANAENDEVLTPAPSPSPKINGPSVFGVRPGSPFLYTIPTTGDRPMAFTVENLPGGLTVDSATGQISGQLTTPGDYQVTLRAKNSVGAADKLFLIKVGDKIALTPPMGWNSWNCWAKAVDQDRVLRSAKAMVSKGLINHGWSYINIDDSWQGKRGGAFQAIEPNEKFPDMKALCDQIHAMGLKAGIYSTPWITSYAGYIGGSSDQTDGLWTKPTKPKEGFRHGQISFAQNDAKQWAAWGFDYLKYDWYPFDLPHVKDMSLALRASGRDIIYSLSNSAPFAQAADWAEWANSWRTTGDIWDQWAVSDKFWRNGVSEIGFSQDRWIPYAGPGHWNDPDMLVVGYVGWGDKLHSTHLSADEQYSHISLWCLLSAPLLIGCDMDRLDDFTIGLLSNDEVLALDQDSLGKEASRVASIGGIDVFSKPLEDGTTAVGFFNRGATSETVDFNKFQLLGLNSSIHVRDLWRQKDLPDAHDSLRVTVAAHGVMLFKVSNTAGSKPAA